MHFKVKIDMFHTIIDYYIGEEELEKLIKVLKQNKLDMTLKKEDFKNGKGLTVQDFVWIKDKKDLKAVVHENYHVVQNLKRYYGFDDEETEAYMNGYLFEEYLKKIKKLTQTT